MKRVHVEEDEEEGVKRTQERMQKSGGGLGQLERGVAVGSEGRWQWKRGRGGRVRTQTTELQSPRAVRDVTQWF